ncbi:hypothetical protein B6E66_09720, partial [Streptomyces maremycinicus]
LRMSCQAAMPLGARAADTVLSRIAGERPAPLKQGFGAQCISLGRRAGIFQFADTSDVAVGLHIPGRPGAKVKELVCRGIIRHLAEEAHTPGGYKLHRAPGTARSRQLRRAERDQAPTVKAHLNAGGEQGRP